MGFGSGPDRPDPRSTDPARRSTSGRRHRCDGTLPLLAPALFSAYLIAFTLSFDEYAIASFLAGTEPTWPVYLFAQLRVPSQLPQLVAVSSIVFVASLLLVVTAEVVRRVVARRYGREFAARGIG